MMALFIALAFITCKKDRKAGPSAKNPYESVRVKQLNKNGTKIIEFSYDNTNRLISSQWTSAYYEDYEYNANGKVTKQTITDLNNPEIKTIVEYSYTNGILKSSNTNGMIAAYYYNNSNKVSHIVEKNSSQVTVGTTSFEYSLSNGELKVSMFFNNNPTLIETYSANLINPNPLQGPVYIRFSPFVIKSREIVHDPKNSSAYDYITDADGKIISYTQTFPNKQPVVTDTYTYIYEPKQ